MTAGTRARRSLAGDVRGLSAVEFAFIAFPLCLALLAFIDLGHRIFLTAHLHGTLQQTARLASIGSRSEAEIDASLKNALAPLIDVRHIAITKKAYSDFSRVRKPEKITSDTSPKGKYNIGDCFEDANGNGDYDLSGGKSGLGGADDIVHYEVTIDYPRLVPMDNFGWSARTTVKASTVLRNQPFAIKAEPKVVCTK